ncbi:choice-of-anchor A family protein [Psychromonas sp. 14N.309.X.WAT.B.A12]|uniref:choice-of-anchor A family protein n=1 Tax=Psychromonas sp. 14N.309.X.WAT.B.A12 TaxID=2998322 RepID=UPI0025AF3EBB|nr:choice-of-anchor A family protein [Psychromonas sp. 14N.309.X.WAT.B.A12]MDN2662232.1 choice-of-anchor A family protein [Psychromonas sp. 14N.309.X.WAT.B.A12]
MKKLNTLMGVALTCYAHFSLAGPIETLNEYNLVVLNDLTSTSEVEGKTIVAGDLSGSASNYGTHLAQNDSSVGSVLVVGSDLSSGTTVNANGHEVIIAGTNNGNINSNSVSNDASQYDFDLIKSEFINFSGYLSELAVNSVLLTSSNNQPSAASFNVGDSVGNDPAVFNITSESFFENNLIQQYDIDLNGQSPSTIIINVSGEMINDSNLGNAVGNITSDVFRENIIWNFFEATEIDLVKQINGSVLAPFADLTNATPIEGSLVVNNFQQNGEVHDALFTGVISYDPDANNSTYPVKVPEPSMFFILLTALAGMMMWNRSKS